MVNDVIKYRIKTHVDSLMFELRNSMLRNDNEKISTLINKVSNELTMARLLFIKVNDPYIARLIDCEKEINSYREALNGY